LPDFAEFSSAELAGEGDLSSADLELFERNHFRLTRTDLDEFVTEVIGLLCDTSIHWYSSALVYRPASIITIIIIIIIISRPPQSALLQCQAPTLLLNRWLACLTGSSILVLKLTFSQDPFPRNLPLSL